MTTILVIIAIIALLLIIPVFTRKVHYVKRSVTIDVPAREVFDFLKLISNQDKFNKWAKEDANRQETFTGVDGTVGYIYAWSGNKNAGAGEKEIIKLIEDKLVETEIRFTKPMKVSAKVMMEIESLSNDQSKVNMINTGALPYPFNLLIPVFEKNFSKDMDNSLATLKNILEKESGI